MKKRLVSLLLVLVMVLGMLPTVAIAADTAPTEIDSADAFAAMEAGGSYKLTKDIEISEPYTNFSGTFDGNGHTITLNIKKTGYAGLFTSLQGMSGGTTVKNLTVDGTVDGDDGDCAGGIAGGASTSNGKVTIENCKNNATITGKRYVGGILGRCQQETPVEIRGCANTGNITATGSYVGGIAGNLDGGSHVIRNCYNTGAITSTSTRSVKVAGILAWAGGDAAVTVENCYTTGAITPNTSAIANSYNNTAGKVINCYALEDTAAALVSGIAADEKTSFKSAENMQTADFVDALGTGFLYKENNYPTLSWEVPTASVPFAISPAAATLTITKDGAQVYSGTGAEQTVSLPAGTYAYTVSCAGYTPKTDGTFEVTTAQATAGATLDEISVTLAEDASAWKTIKVSKTPDFATVTILDAAGNEVQPESDGSYKLLADGKYTYTATTTEIGYEDVTGDVVAVDNTLSINLPKVQSLEIKTSATKLSYYQGDTLKTDGLVLTVHYTNADDQTIEAKDFATKGVMADYDFTKASDASDVTLSYKGAAVTYQVTVEERPDVFAGIRKYATITYDHNTSYTGTEGEEFVFDNTAGALKSNSAGQTSSQVSVTITWNNDAPKANLSLKYKVSTKDPGYFSASDGLQIDSSYSKIGGEVDWTEYTKTMTAGSTLKLTYVRSYSTYGDFGSDCFWVKDFTAAPLYTLTLTTNVNTAAVVLTDEAGRTVSGTNGVYSVTPGTYHYTVDV